MLRRGSVPYCMVFDSLKWTLQIIPLGKFNHVSYTSPEVSSSPRICLFIFHHGLYIYDESYTLPAQAHSNLHTIMLYGIGNEYFLMKTNECTL